MHAPDVLDKRDFKQQDNIEGDVEDDILETDVDDDGDDDVPTLLPDSSQERRDESLKAWLEGEAVDFQLAVGAVVVREMRSAVYQKLGFTCSAGIAHNKVCTVCLLCSCAC